MRFVQINTRLSQRVGYFVVRARTLVHFQRAIETPAGLINLAGFQIHVADVGEQIGAVMEDCSGLFVRLRRFIPFFQFDVGRRQVGVNEFVERIDLYLLLVSVERLFVLSFTMVQKPQIVEDVFIVRVDLDLFFVGFLGLVQHVQSGVGPSEVVPCIGMLRILGRSVLEERSGCFESAPIQRF